MARTRPGRGSRKSETRQQLLGAAAQVVAEKGFAGASLMEIAERAELTTGAVYSNFRSKEALMLALVSEQLDLMGGEPPASAEELLAEARKAAEITADPEVQDIFRAQVEIFLLGLRDATVREELQRREAALVDAVANVLENVAPPRLDAPTPTTTQLAELFFAAIQGLQQHRLMFPEAVPPEVFDWLAAAILKAASETNATRPDPPLRAKRAAAGSRTSRRVSRTAR